MEIVFVVGLPLSLAKSTGPCSIGSTNGLPYVQYIYQCDFNTMPHTFGANLEKALKMLLD